MRLDKMLAKLGYGSRNDIKKYCKQKRIKVNGDIISKSDYHVDENNDVVEIDGETVKYREFIYLMMNKPDGVVSATFDNYDETVIDLIAPEYQVFEPFPVGRLDKDTEGLLVITNDGKLSHRVLSPKKHVPKTYYVEVDSKINDSDIDLFSKGLNINDEYITKPAKLEIIGEEDRYELDNCKDRHGEDTEVFRVYVTISEGKFHQVKRMFKAVGKNVLYLKRIKMGSLRLDETLELGEYREMTDEEISLLEK